MKRLAGLMICLILLWIGIPASAWFIIHPLENEPFYDPSSGILSGTIVWSAIDGDNKLHYINLETGETNRFDLDGYHYPVYSDLPGAVVAREYNRNLFLYQIDLEGDLTPILEMQLPSTAYFYRGSYLPATVWAYYDGWLYYNQSENYSEAVSLVRINQNEGGLFIYHALHAHTRFALSPSGLLAWFEDDIDGREETALFIQNPEDGSIAEIPFAGKYAEMKPSDTPVWLDEDTLVFCCYSSEDDAYSLYSYRFSTGEAGIISNEVGSKINVPLGIPKTASFDDSKTQLAMMEPISERGYIPCIFDMQTGKKYKIIDSGYAAGNRIIWYND